MNRLKELRQEKGLTQQALADEMEVTKRTYIYWEKGDRQIKPEKAQQLADYFGVSVGYLLGYESEYSISKDFKKEADILFTNETKNEFFDFFEKLPKNSREEVINFLKFKTQQEIDDDSPDDTNTTEVLNNLQEISNTLENISNLEKEIEKGVDKKRKIESKLFEILPRSLELQEDSKKITLEFIELFLYDFEEWKKIVSEGENKDIFKRILPIMIYIKAKIKDII